MFKRPFGQSNPPQDGVPLADIVRRRYPSLVLDLSTSDVERALTTWAWLAPPRTNAALIGAFGDLFFETSEGIVMLDLLEGVLRTVAKDREAFLQAIEDDDYRDELLGDVWVQAAARRGIELGTAECLDWMPPPILGGQCSAESLVKLPTVAKINMAGQLHQQVRNVPPDFRITGVTVSD